MPEIENNQAAGTGNGEGEGQNANADGKKEGSDAGAGQGDNGEGGESGGAASENKEGGQAKAPKEGDEEVDDGSEPESRKRLSKQDFIIGRQRAKLAKNQAKAGEAANKEGGEGGDGDDDDDTDVAPEDEALINKVISKNVAPLIQPIIDKTLASEDEQEVQDFLKDNPDFKPFEGKVRRYMAHPSRRNLPIKSIFYEVAGDKLIKIGAERQKAADAKARETQTGGGSNRSGDEVKNDWELSPEEFAKKQDRIRRGQ